MMTKLDFPEKMPRQRVQEPVPDAARPVLSEDYVPLYNFQLGSNDFRNTCFIAAVANLRHVLQPVMEITRRRTWKDFIIFARNEWKGKYAFAPEHDGQHDAAELLGDILHGTASWYGVEISVTTQIFGCNHNWETVRRLPMIVLQFREQRDCFELQELIDDYVTPAEVNSRRCEECGCDDMSGLLTHCYRKSLSGKLVFRINRYSVAGRRSDPVILDESIIFDNGDLYDLQAILQHEGESARCGHYIMFLRTSTAWECRNDGTCVEHDGAKLPPYSPESVYILVYALRKKVTVPESPQPDKQMQQSQVYLFHKTPRV